MGTLYYSIDGALGACIIGTGSLCDLRCQKGYFSRVKMSTHTSTYKKDEIICTNKNTTRYYRSVRSTNNNKIYIYIIGIVISYSLYMLYVIFLRVYKPPFF